MPDVEETIRAHADGGDVREAVRVAIEAYGAEVYGFLVVRMRDHQDASDVFSDMTEDILRGLPRFEFRCSFRTWLYTLARNAATRFEKAPANQRRRRVSISRISEREARERTETRPYMKTGAKDELSSLRAQLDAEDQTLLVLRLDRQLSWNDVALVMADVEGPSDAEVKRLAARFRKRFETIKQRLAALAAEQGLFGKQM